MLNKIVWNRADYMYKMDLALNNLQRLICHKTHSTNQPCTNSTSYNWYNHHFHVEQCFFQFSSKVQVLIFLFTFFQFYSAVSRDSKFLNSASPLSFFNVVFEYYLSGLQDLIIKTDLNNAVVCTVLILPLISSSYWHFSWLLGTVLSIPTMVGIFSVLW